MEQTIEESVEAEDVEVREEPNQVDKIAEKRFEECHSKSSDKDGNEIDYKRREPEKGFKYKSNAKEVFSRNSLKRSDLEGKISNWRKEARELGKDETEYVSLKLAQRPIFYSGNSDEERESEQGEDTPNGVLAFIYHRNTETGELELLFEQIKPDYYQTQNRGKIKPFGGFLKTTDKSSVDGFVREAWEEFEAPAAQIIIKAAINDGKHYARKYYKEGGISGYTDILEIEIKSNVGWEIAKNAITKHDAGRPIVLTDSIAHQLNDEYYAFGYGPFIKEFISEKLGIKDPSPYIKFIPFTYKDSFIPNYYSSPKSASLVKLSMNQK